METATKRAAAGQRSVLPLGDRHFKFLRENLQPVRPNSSYARRKDTDLQGTSCSKKNRSLRNRRRRVRPSPLATRLKIPPKEPRKKFGKPRHRKATRQTTRQSLKSAKQWLQSRPQFSLSPRSEIILEPSANKIGRCKRKSGKVPVELRTTLRGNNIVMKIGDISLVNFDQFAREHPTILFYNNPQHSHKHSRQIKAFLRDSENVRPRRPMSAPRPPRLASSENRLAHTVTRPSKRTDVMAETFAQDRLLGV